jgi:hypothetical protein
MVHELALLSVEKALKAFFRLWQSSKGQLNASVPSECRTTEQKANQLEATCFERAATHDDGQDNVLKR